MGFASLRNLNTKPRRGRPEAGLCCWTPALAPRQREPRPGMVARRQHMAKIIECASLCCVPGGRDSILATLDQEGFELESMAPQRRATPVSVAAHSLYEQSDPFTVRESEGRLDLARATYHALDERRTRVVGAVWEERSEPWVKIEGARHVGERAILLCGTADPRFIARHEQLL